jgi:hypothetical protein
MKILILLLFLPLPGLAQNHQAIIEQIEIPFVSYLSARNAKNGVQECNGSITLMADSVVIRIDKSRMPYRIESKEVNHHATELFLIFQRGNTEVATYVRIEPHFIFMLVAVMHAHRIVWDDRVVMKRK